MREYIVMAVDELGDEYRPHILADMIFKFPDFDESDECMWSAFLAWQESCMNKNCTKIM